MTCPLHRTAGMQQAGSEAAANADHVYNREPAMMDDEDEDMPNGDVPLSRALDRSGMAWSLQL